MKFPNESKSFASWIGRQGVPTILESQSEAVINILERMDNGDLISVLFHGSDEVAAKALHELKERYQDEMYWLDQIASARSLEMEDETDWG